MTTEEALIKTLNGYKRQARELARQIPEQENVPRVSGDVVCDYCELCYYDHPTVNGRTMVCGGQQLKL